MNAVTNITAGGVAQGGSTLTMQYVKNVLLTNARSEEEQAAAKAANGWIANAAKYSLYTSQANHWQQDFAKLKRQEPPSVPVPQQARARRPPQPSDSWPSRCKGP